MDNNRKQPATGILVVEDDPAIATVLEEILTGKDYSVRVATNPDEAFAAVVEQLPELVLMDINLSSEIDGIETVRRLRAHHEDLPVCFITAFSDDETVRRAETAGPMAYLVKPFEMADVLTMVNISLASARRMKERLKKVMAQAGGQPEEQRPSTPPPVLETEDKLTGLPNRHAVENQVSAWALDSQNFAAVLTVDHVQLLRNRFGAGALDQILFSYSQHIGQHLPDDCILSRWNDATFVVTPREGGLGAQREVARVVAAPMLYHLRLPGRTALLRVCASMRVVFPKGKPVAGQIEAIVAAHR